MPLQVLLLILFLFLTGALERAHASDNVVVRKRQGLFVFEDFQHWSKLNYRYSDHNSNQSDAGTSVLHTFEESYDFILGGAIKDPHFIDLSLKGGILFDQIRSRNDSVSSSNNDTKYQYNLSGIGLDRSETPFNLKSYRDINTVDTTYSSPYTTDRTGNEFDITIKNALLKSRFYIAHLTNDIKGEGYSSNSISNAYSYSADHSYKNFVSTGLNLSFSDQKGRGSSGSEEVGSSNMLNFTNQLLLGPQSKYTFLTEFNLNNSENNSVPQRSIIFRESFKAEFGRALSLNTVYSLDKSRSSNFDGKLQESTRNLGEVSLKYKLYKSIETTLNGKVSSYNQNNGTENRYSTAWMIKYFKQLPAKSQLAVYVNKSYERVERRAGSQITSIVDELHPGVHQGDSIELPLTDATLQSVVSIKSRAPIYTYVEGKDYIVNYTHGRIEIQTGSDVKIDMTGSGMDLYISYSVYKDPLITYLNNSFSVSSDLRLLNNKFLIGASYSDSQPTIVSGPDSNSLRETRTLMLYGVGNSRLLDYRLDYRNVDTGGFTYQSFEGMCKTGWNTFNSSSSLLLRNRYYLYDANSTRAGYSENTSEVVASYLRRFKWDMKLTIQANALETRSSVKPPRDTITLRTTYKIQLNDTFIDIFGMTGWTLFSGVTTRDDSVNVNVTRYF